MADGRIQRMIEEILESGRPPEEVCRDHPDLLPALLVRLRRTRAMAAELDAMFPTTSGGPADAAAPRPGDELPRIAGYDVLSVLGHGGMGVVFEARHQRLDRRVAIKMLLAGGYAGPPEVERFLREAEAVARLRHPHVVQVYDVGEHDGRPYFTMELVEGGNLARRLAATPQPIAEAVDLVTRLADAIHAAHESGIVHRDLKPANVLLDADGTPKISDFGLARRIDDPALTLSGARLGTPSYMAPEQALGRSHAIGPAVDVYALGALLYETLTGRPPFRGESAAETERLVISAEPMPPSRLNHKVPRDLETICLACLGKDPERRYASAQALADDLRRFRRGEAITARAVGPVERLVRWMRRNPTETALILTSAALVALAIATAAREWAYATQQRAEASKWTERISFVHGLQAEGRFAEARAILGRLPDGGFASLRQRIERAQADLAVAERLDELRLARGFGRTDRFDAAADQAYQDAFADAGLAMFAAPPAELARRIDRSDVRLALITALDDWVSCVRERDRLERLLEVARRADPDPWRDRVRDPTLWNDVAALVALAAEAAPAEQPVGLLLVVAGLLDEAGHDSIRFLRRAHLVHPNDFWLNFTMAELHPPGDAAIGYYLAALAVRPRAIPVHVNLGIILSHLGRTDEAMEQWNRALEIDPDAPEVILNVAIAEGNLGRLEPAMEGARRSIRLDPANPTGYGVLGWALRLQARFDEALVALHDALDRTPTDDPSWSFLRAEIERVEKRIALEARIPALLDGTVDFADEAERLDVVRLLLLTRRHAAAADVYAAAFAANPALAADVVAGHRYDAACAAALAGTRQDPGAAPLSAEERAARRRLARRWLREELAAWTAEFERRDAASLELLPPTLAQWRDDPDLAGVRDAAELAAFPPAEREECAAFWREVDALLAEVARDG